MNRLPACAFSLILCAMIIVALPARSPAGTPPRSCVVKEVVKGGIYVYLRCLEKDKDIWLATVARAFTVDEVISFVDAPPMINFFSQQLERTFPEVILTDILPPEPKKK